MAFHSSTAHVGFLYTQLAKDALRPKVAIEQGLCWAMDNGCYKEYDPQAIIRMMDYMHGKPRCKFMVAPDVVCDHEATLMLFRAWVGTIQRYGYPIAFVLQNGISPCSIPWGSLDAIFIGGDTAFKFSNTVRLIVQEAKQRGKWVHMGRVNSQLRITYAKSIGCDSFDGSGFHIAPKKNIPPMVPYYTGYRQMNLWEALCS